MSIDTPNQKSVQTDAGLRDCWESLNEKLRRNIDRRGTKKIFGDWAKDGSIYRWGVAVAKSAPCDSLTNAISRLATDQPRRKKDSRNVDLALAAEAFVDWIESTSDLTAVDCASVVTWGAALPGLADDLGASILQSMIESMCRLRQSVTECNKPSSPSHLMIGAELGLTLAWRCRGLRIARGLRASGIEALIDWSKAEQESISATLEQPIETRLTLASALRCKRLIQKTTKSRWNKQAGRTSTMLATWVAAATTHTGSSMFSSATSKHVRDDTHPLGLLYAACSLDPECLTAAVKAALGQSPSGGRLAWQVSLPETLHHDPDAKVAVMFPDWDVRRGRTHIDYSGQDVRVEIFSGRKQVIGGTGLTQSGLTQSADNGTTADTGTWHTRIETEQSEQRPDGPWTEICEYSDDDVHYLEIEQPWTAGLLLQRQFMLIRDDRCLMLADSIIPQNEEANFATKIQYSCRLPLGNSIGMKRQPETREAFLSDKSKRALVIPMSASEWIGSPTVTCLDQSGEGHLALTTSGRRRLYAPLWFDFQKRRFKRMRTWRQLTIADQLRIVGRDEAIGYRVQVGSEQWVVYRSLGERACRSFLGKHLIADFFSARFDPEDGGHEALVTVDDNEHDE